MSLPPLNLQQSLCSIEVNTAMKSVIYISSLICRLHPSSAHLRRRDRLHLSLLEHRLWRQRRLPVIRQRVVQTPVREPGHHPEGRGLPALHHHVVLSTQELQEVYQKPRRLPESHRVLPIARWRPRPRGQDKIYIQPGGPRVLREHGVSFIIWQNRVYSIWIFINESILL